MSTTPPSSSSWTSWWNGIVAESDKRCQLENQEPSAPVLPDLAPSFFNKQMESIDAEARRRLEEERVQNAARIRALEPVESEGPKPPPPFSTSLNLIKELYLEVDQEAEKRFEESNQPGSFLDVGSLVASAIDLVQMIASKAKEGTSRPLVIGGIDINYRSNPASNSEEEQKKMAAQVAAIQQASLSLEELDIINGEFIEESSFFIDSPEIDLPESSASKSGKEKVVHEVQDFCKPLIAYLTFYLLHEIIAGQKAAPDESRDLLYQMMTRLFMEDSERIDPLWDIYYEQLGKNLSRFGLIKVRLFYLLFYALTDFIPTLIRECSKHATSTFYDILTDEKKLDLLISIALERAENYLTLLNSSILECGEKNGEKGNLDTYKKGVIHKIFKEDLDKKLEELIKRASRKAIDYFFPKITFCELGKISTLAPLQWAGQRISICINFVTQNLLAIFLKTIVVPTLLRLILKKWLSEDPNDVYLLRYKLQKAILEHIQKMNQTLNQPKEKKEKSDVEVSNSRKLETIASGLTRILTIPSDESPEVIRSHYESQSLEKRGMNKALKKGILKAGHGIIGTLHNQTLFEETLTKMLAASKKTLLGSMERSHPKSFASLKNDYKREKRELRKETDKLALGLTDEMIDDAIGSDLEAFDQRTGRIQAKIQYKMEWLAVSLGNFMSHIEAILRDPENSFDDEVDCSPGTALIDMDNFWTQIQEFIQQMDMQGLAKQQGKAMPSALKEGLDSALEPLRKKTQETILLAQTFDQMHKEYHLHLTIKRELQNSLDCLRTIKDALQNSDGPLADTFSYIPICTKKVFRLLQKFPNFINEKEQKEIRAKEQLLLGHLKEIDHQEMIISELNSLIEESGPVYQLVLFMQRQSLRPFNSEKARNDIRKIFEKTKLPPSLMTLIDHMQRFTSRADDSNWDNLEPFILDQLPEKSHLRRKFQTAFDDWRSLERGTRHFNEKIWEESKKRFLEDLRKERLPCDQAASLLDQVEGFLRKNSILNARWNQFCEEIEKAREVPITKSQEMKKLYTNEAIEFYERLEFYRIESENHQNRLRKQLIDQIPEIQSKLDLLRISAQKLQIKTPFSSEFTLTSAGTIFGSGLGTLTAILGAPLWAALGTGAAVGYLLGKNIRPICRGYSQKRIIPYVHELLGKAQEEVLQLHTRQVIAFSLLDAFGE